MFYEKLAQAKEEKRREGLSAGQKIGVGLGGLAGGLAIPSALSHIPALDRAMFESDFSRQADDLARKYTGEGSILAANNAYNAAIRKHRADATAEKERIWEERSELEDTIKRQARQAGVSAEDIDSEADEYLSWKLNHNSPETEALAELDAAETRGFYQMADAPNRHQARDDIAQAAYDAVKREHADLASEIPTLRESHKRIMGKRAPLFLAPSILAAGYGTKKLFDRYNARKQRKD